MFKNLGKKAHLAHIRHTYQLAPTTEDKQIYTIASKEKQLIVTQDAGFRKWIRSSGSGIFVIPSYLSNTQIDDIVTYFISGKNPEDFIGKVTKISLSKTVSKK